MSARGGVAGRWRAAAVVVGIGALVAVLPATAGAAGPSGGVVGPDRAALVAAPVFTRPLHDLGPVNLSALAAHQATTPVAQVGQGSSLPAVASTAGASGSRFRAVEDRAVTHAVHRVSAAAPAAAPSRLTTSNVAGEQGFDGLGGVQQAATFGGLDLEPPDQGLCAGGGYVVELVNNALAVYTTSGIQLLSPVGSPALFRQPATAFMSDPRCYYDAPTGRWFLQEFVLGSVNPSGVATAPSVQFEAVSNSADPTQGFEVYSWTTTDAGTPGCPCFGDYDQLGADANGIYVTTDEFSIAGPAFDGVIVYALSKALLETAQETGILPTLFGYRLTSDPFGQPAIVAPTTTPPGAGFAPGTEYFVESNGNQAADHRLVVYALNDTSLLAAPAAPSLYRTTVATEAYAAPVDAVQRSGPHPLGAEYQSGEGGIQADFDAAMESTYVGGNIYAELDTLTATGTDGVDWFVLHPTLSGSSLTATVVHQGIVTVPGVSLLYPYTALDSAGSGYLLFSLSGRSVFPSPAYVSYHPTGPTGPVHLATTGADPEDGFTCYAAFVGPGYGGCRWGDYSMGVAVGSRIIMAAEMVPPGFRDLLTNWGTYIWSAPAP